VANIASSMSRLGHGLLRLCGQAGRISTSRHATSAAAKESQAASLPTPGKDVGHGWRCVAAETVAELGVSAIQLRHEHCQAQYLHLAASDAVNAFAVAFRTTPADSTGVSHILEHTALCGSSQHPVRDPFFKMINRSLSTFMNAMTGPDYTVYPFATQNAVDFNHLLTVYLDAAFRPLLREQDFRQEGWRLEQQDLEDGDSALAVKGVVFNEMKGVYADSQQLFGRHLLSAALPSHTYGHCSGGLPEKIPDLTWKQLKDFHAKHYSVDNAKFYSYGDLPLESHLAVLATYLPTQDSSGEPAALVPNELRWSAPRTADITCAPDPASPETSTLAVSYVGCDVSDSYESFVLQLVGELLTDGSNAPFYKSLLESGLGTNYAPSSGYGAHTKDTLFTIGVQGMSLKKKDAVLAAIRKTFATVAEEGFDQQRVDAVLNKTELSLKYQSNNYGLGLILALTPLLNHEPKDALEPLRINGQIARLRADMKTNPDFLQGYVRKYFIENQHQIALTMSPSETYLKEQEKTLDEVRARLVDAVDQNEKGELLAKGKALREAQDAKEDLSCLPCLSMADIAQELPTYDVQELELSGGVPAQLSAQPTNGVAYFRALLGTQEVSPELRPYLPLFTSVLTSMGAGQYDHRQLHTQIDLCSGGFSTSLHVQERPTSLASVGEAVLIGSHCLERNASRMLDLWAQIFNELRTDDDERLRVLVNMLASDAINGVAFRGHAYAMGSAAASIIPGGQLRDAAAGINHIRLLNELAREGDLDECIRKIKQLAKILLVKTRMRMALNTSSGHSDQFQKQADDFSSKLLGDQYAGDQPANIDFKATSKNSYYMAPFPVQYCSLALPGIPFSHEDHAALSVACKLISSKFLHKEIREKGGAYGGGLSAGPALTFYSYRDPGFETTLATFKKAAEWCGKKNSFSEQDLLEAKIGIFQRTDSPVVPGARGVRRFLTSVDDEAAEKFRRGVRQVTQQDLVEVAGKYLNANKAEAAGVAVIGPAQSVDQREWEVQSIV